MYGLNFARCSLTVVLRSQVEELNFYTNNREWTLLATTVEKRGVKYECCPQLYPDVTFSFILQRSSPSYRALLILPCLGTPN